VRSLASALIIVLAIAGGYFLIFHRDLPLNHEDVGLGTFHTLHDVIGVVLLVLAGVVWWRSRKASTASRPAT
jgi:membrane protein DedA with SNARE-associated domain